MSEISYEYSTNDWEVCIVSYKKDNILRTARLPSKMFYLGKLRASYLGPDGRAVILATPLWKVLYV